MKRKYLLSAGAFLGLTAFSIATAQADCGVAGRYMAKGQMTGSSSFYKGEVVIKDEGGDCFVRWLPPNTSSGIGTYAGGVLTVDFTLGGKQGVVQYKRASNGVMAGAFWAKGHPDDIQGTETLTPIN